MKNSILGISLVCVAGGWLAVRPAEAAVVMYTNKALFLGAVAAGAYEEGFTGSAGLSSSQNFSGGVPVVFQYTVTSLPTSPTSVYRNGQLIAAAADTGVLTLTITSGNVYGIGGNFFKTNFNDVFQPGASVSISVDGAPAVTVNPATVNDFVGFVSDTPLTTLTVSSSAPLYSAVDNLVVATAVPEPALAGLLASGLGFLLYRRRR